MLLTVNAASDPA